MTSKYFLVTDNGSSQYIEFKSEWSFSKEEGVATIKESRPNAEVLFIPKYKAVKVLGLSKV